MGFLLSFDAVKRILYIEISGEITDDVFLDGYQAVRDWMAIHGQCSHISDFTSAASFKVSSEAIRNFASQPPLVSDDFLRVVVAPQDVVYGMVRMFASYGGRTRGRVDIFHTLEEAYAFLGVTSLDLVPVE